MSEYFVANGHPPMAENVVLIDFDGTIYPLGPLDDDQAPNRSAVEAIRELRSVGYRVRIFSSRLSETWLDASGEKADEQLALMAWRLDRDGIDHDGFAFDKEPARFYIDDRAIAYRDNWEAIAGDLTWEMQHEHQFRCSCGKVASR